MMEGEKNEKQKQEEALHHALPLEKLPVYRLINMIMPWRFVSLMASLLSTIRSASAHEDEPSPRLPAVVSTTWLSENLNNPSVIVVDLRESQAYTAGHVPASISLPYQGTALWTSKGPENETLIIPSAEVIAKTLSENGLGTDRLVVFVPDATTLPLHMAMATRAAATLRYAGFAIRKLTILDGGYPAWAAAKLPVSTVVAAAKPLPKQSSIPSKTDMSFLIERVDVRARIGKAAEGVVIIDARGAADYRAGHIPSAISLPGNTIWNTAGFWKPAGDLQDLFEAAVGTSPVGKHKGEVIVYCWVGMLATTWVYALSNVLGYENVKLYDGSFEDWLKYGEAVTGPEA